MSLMKRNGDKNEEKVLVLMLTAGMLTSGLAANTFASIPMKSLLSLQKKQNQQRA